AGAPVLAAACSYAAFVGGDETEVTTGDDDGNFHGCFFRNSKIKVTDITDGTSHTAFAAERACGITQGTWAGAIPGGRMRRAPGPPSHNPSPTAARRPHTHPPPPAPRPAANTTPPPTAPPGARGPPPRCFSPAAAPPPPAGGGPPPPPPPAAGAGGPPPPAP